MKILVLGIRGMPGVEGGVETHAEHLYPRLAAMGCDVEVLVRTPFSPKGADRFGAIRLTRIWSPRTTGLEALVHSLLGVLYAGLRRPDILHLHAVGPSLVTPIARLLGLRVVMTHHGPDYDRAKWGPIARTVLRLGERSGVVFSHSRISISPVIRDLIRSKYGRESVIIPNGVMRCEPVEDASFIRSLGLEPGRYFLHVGRMVPEKRQLDLIDAYSGMQSDRWKLAIVGGLSDDAYSRKVTDAGRNAGVVLAGFLEGASLRQIYTHAGAFVLPSTHEGLPIVILEALSYGLPILASDIAANLAIGLDASCYFPVGDRKVLRDAMIQLSSRHDDVSSRNERRRWVSERFNWDEIAARTAGVYAGMLESGS